MKKQEKVTIVVPVYNVEKYLNKCLNSIINQTYTNLEIIIVNDGSTDNSEKIINNLKLKDKRIKYVKKKNGGLSSARNKGIELATGKYICFVDSDDWISSKYVETLINALERDNSDIAICNMKYVYIDNSERKNVPHIDSNACLNTKEAFSIAFCGNKFRFHAVNKMYKTKLFLNNNIRYPQNKIYEDMFTTYRLMLKSNKISLTNEYLYYYLQNRIGSIQNTTINERRFDILNALDEIVNNETINSFKIEKEKQALYVTNIIALVNYIYPVYTKKNIENIKKYIYKVLNDKNSFLLKGAYKNSKISIKDRIRVSMLKTMPILYCVIMKILKKGK